MIETAKKIALKYCNQHRGDGPKFKMENIHVVWYSEALRGWKAVVSVGIEDCLYFDVEHNEIRQTTYVDVYTKKDSYLVD